MYFEFIMAYVPPDKEIEFRAADLELKKRELDLRQQELGLKQTETGHFKWSNPLVVAGVAALAAILGAALQIQQQHNALELENKKFHYSVQQAKVERIMSALVSYSSAYTKRSSQIFVATAQLAPDVDGVIQQTNPSYEAALEIANRYGQIAKDTTDWLSETGPPQSVLEVMTGRKGPSGQFKTSVGLGGFVDHNDVGKRKDLLRHLQRELGDLQRALLDNSRASIEFTGAIQQWLTDEVARAAP